jgi:hypothetical protein
VRKHSFSDSSGLEPIPLVGRIQRTQKDPDIKYYHKLHQMWCNCLLLKEAKRTNRQCFSGTFGDSHLAHSKACCLELEISWRLSMPPCLHSGFNGYIACVLQGPKEDEGPPCLCASKAQMKMRARAHLQSIRSFVKRNLNYITYLGGIVEQIPKVGIWYPILMQNKQVISTIIIGLIGNWVY